MIYLSLGSNLGNRLKFLQLAVGLISYRISKVKNVSRIYETPAMGFRGNPFYNICVGINTDLQPKSLLEKLLDIDDHDVEVGFETSYAGAEFYVGRFVKSATVEGDTYAQVSYPLFGFDTVVGVGDGAYTESNDFGVVNVAFSYGNDDGYGASLIYNPDVERTYFVVSKAW